jgi:hypothetical protein
MDVSWVLQLETVQAWRTLRMLPATWDREAAGIAVKSKHAQHGKE